MTNTAQNTKLDPDDPALLISWEAYQAALKEYRQNKNEKFRNGLGDMG